MNSINHVLDGFMYRRAMSKTPMSIILLQCKPLNKRFTIQLNKITSCLLCPILASVVCGHCVCFVLLQWQKKIGLSHLISPPSSRLTTYNKLPSLTPEPGGGGGGELHMKQTGMLVLSLRGVNFGSWSRLGCSVQSANILSRQGLV